MFLEQGLDAMDDRFTYASTLVSLLQDTGLEEPFKPLLAAYAREKAPVVLSELYGELDEALAELQKKVFTHEQYPLYAAYFEKLFEVEREMALHLDSYNDKARYYNMQRGGFPASIAAKRLKMQALELFTVAPAIKGRP